MDVSRLPSGWPPGPRGGIETCGRCDIRVSLGPLSRARTNFVAYLHCNRLQ